MALIEKNNLDQHSLSNAEVLALLERLSVNVDGSAASRIMDAIEDLTGDRHFENSKVDQAQGSLVLKVAKAKQYAELYA